MQSMVVIKSNINEKTRVFSGNMKRDRILKQYYNNYEPTFEDKNKKQAVLSMI